MTGVVAPLAIPTMVSGYQPASAQGAVLPGTARLDLLNQPHPEYVAFKDIWEGLETLYRGGALLRQRASMFLRKRPKELQDLYAFRLGMFSYQNILGAGIDYYLASVFRKPPEIDFKERGPDGNLYDVTDIPDESRAFFTEFERNCDTKGTTITDFFREVLKNLLVYGKSWMLLDLPNPDTPVYTRADQTGWMPYLVNFTPLSIINWSDDQYGVLEWAVIRTEIEQRVWLGESRKITRWYKFDRTHFEVYEAEANKYNSMPDLTSARLVNSGYHALAEQNMVPLQRIVVPEGLWLANRVLPQVLDHLNTDNAYAFALFMANLAMPVIIGKAKDVITLSEAGCLQLPEGSQFQWAEPVGTSFERSELRVAALREEIYRSMYLMPQGRSAAASPSVQSGYSKQLDMAPSAEVQNLFGDIIRAAMKRVLDQVAFIHGEEFVFDVRGFTAMLEPAIEAITEAQQFAALAIQSDTAHREMQKKIVRIFFSDMASTIIDQMCQEIDEGPTLEEQQQQEQQMQQDQFAQQFDQENQQKQLEGEQQKDLSEHQATVDEAKSQADHEREMERMKAEHKLTLERENVKGKTQLQIAKSRGNGKPKGPVSAGRK